LSEDGEWRMLRGFAQPLTADRAYEFIRTNQTGGRILLVRINVLADTADDPRGGRR
jgi:hypothetical protein